MIPPAELAAVYNKYIGKKVKLLDIAKDGKKIELPNGPKEGTVIGVDPMPKPGINHYKENTWLVIKTIKPGISGIPDTYYALPEQIQFI